MSSTKTLCWICLNSSPKLKSLIDSGYIDFLQKIIGQQFTYLQLKSIYVCVYCAAVLRKCENFHSQVKKSYNLLSQYIKQNHDTSTLTKPSTLQTVYQYNITYDPNATFLVSEYSTMVVKTEIKIEPDILNAIPSDNSDIDEPLIKLKKSKKKKKKKKQHKDIYKKIILSPEEIQKERDDLVLAENFANAELRCDHCIITFANQGDVLDHVSKKHDESLPFKCDICSCYFNNEVTYTYHTTRHKTRLLCLVCDKLFSSQNAVTKHYYMEHCGGLSVIPETHQKEKSDGQSEHDLHNFKCDLCPKVFKFRSSLRKHMDSHLVASGRKRKPTCEPCGLSFTNTANLQKHIKTSSKHQMKLKLRRLEQSDPSKIEEIKSSVENRTVYNCECCDKSFQWRGNLSRHMKSHIAKANGELSCEPCGRVFASIATYQQHMKLSKKHVSEHEFKYMCSDCGAKFVSKTKLTDHINWEHLKRYKHVCKECKKVFKTHTSLYVHTQFVHKKSQEYLCDICGKSFPMKSKLASHIAGGHRLGSLRCCACAATFSWSSCLSRHHAAKHACRRTNAGHT